MEAGWKEDQKVEGREEVIVVHSSDSEGQWPDGVQTLGLSRETKEVLENQPDPTKQVVPFQSSKEKSEPETRRAEDYIALPDQPAQEQWPTVEQIHQTCLAKYPDTLPPGPVSMASESPAYLAIPTASKPPRPPSPPQQQQNDQPASWNRSSRIGFCI
jgi:hypothetical protein